jgi:hypothetical protein
MRVLIDTTVWSLALRRSEPNGVTQRLLNLITSSSAVMIGSVRQELLSGISNDEMFKTLKAKLDAFDDHPLTKRDYETAAQFFNTCRKHGIQGSHTDFLLCAVAANHDFAIFTTDNDFTNYAKVLPIKLFS